VYKLAQPLCGLTTKVLAGMKAHCGEWIGRGIKGEQHWRHKLSALAIAAAQVDAEIPTCNIYRHSEPENHGGVPVCEFQPAPG